MTNGNTQSHISSTEFQAITFLPLLFGWLVGTVVLCMAMAKGLFVDMPDDLENTEAALRYAAFAGIGAMAWSSGHAMKYWFSYYYERSKWAYKSVALTLYWVGLTIVMAVVMAIVFVY